MPFYASQKPRSIYGFLAIFGDLGWGKAEGRRQKSEEGNYRFKL
jgi:hypothetical protein